MPKPHTTDRPLRLAILGGGQLAKMLAMSARQLGCEVVIVEKQEDCPARAVAHSMIVGDYNHAEIISKLVKRVDVVTLENEFIDVTALQPLVEHGLQLYPTPTTIALCQDKWQQKQTLRAAKLPVMASALYYPNDDAHALGAQLGWPLVLKQRRNGYDGKGNVTVTSPADLNAAASQLQGPLYAEAFCKFQQEIATIVCRAIDGSTQCYPIVTTKQVDHICHHVVAPANLPVSLQKEAQKFAIATIDAIDGVGSFGIEMFVTADQHIVINEIAPRVHNSGHYTIEGCHCSQFENHIRAISGWPLGDSQLCHQAAAMVNLLGIGSGTGQPHGIAAALALPGIHLHIYGKQQSRKGRKMGHLTVVGDNTTATLAKAQAAADLIRFGDVDVKK